MWYVVPCVFPSNEIIGMFARTGLSGALEKPEKNIMLIRTAVIFIA
jgi:hypothetical protein